MCSGVFFLALGENICYNKNIFKKTGGTAMGSIVEAAVCGMVGKVIGVLVLLPMGLLFLGYLTYIAVSVFKELPRK